jgi:hypothetical protein
MYIKIFLLILYCQTVEVMAVITAERHDSRRVLVLEFMAVSDKPETFQKESKSVRKQESA